MAKKKATKAKIPAAKTKAVTEDSTEENSTTATPVAAPSAGRATRASARLRRRESETPATASGESSPSRASSLNDASIVPPPPPKPATRKPRVGSARGRKITQKNDADFVSLTNGEGSSDQAVNGVSVDPTAEELANAQELLALAQQGPSIPKVENGSFEEKPTISQAPIIVNPRVQIDPPPSPEDGPLFREEPEPFDAAVTVKKEIAISVKQEPTDSGETGTSAIPAEKEQEQTYVAPVNVKVEPGTDPAEDHPSEVVNEAPEDNGSSEDATAGLEKLPLLNGSVSVKNERGDEISTVDSTTNLNVLPSKEIKQELIEGDEEAFSEVPKTTNEVVVNNDRNGVGSPENPKFFMVQRNNRWVPVTPEKEEPAPRENVLMEIGPQLPAEECMIQPVSTDSVRNAISLPLSTSARPPPSCVVAPPPPPPSFIPPRKPIVAQPPPPPPPLPSERPSVFSAFVIKKPTLAPVPAGIFLPSGHQLKTTQTPEQKARLDDELKRIAQQISFEKTLRQTIAATGSVEAPADPLENLSKMAEMWKKSAGSAAEAEAIMQQKEQEKAEAEEKRKEEEKLEMQKKLEEAKKKAAALLETFQKQHNEHKAIDPSTDSSHSSPSDSSTVTRTPDSPEHGDENKKHKEDKKASAEKKDKHNESEKKRRDSDKRKSRSRSRDRHSSRSPRRSRSPLRSPRRHRSRDRSRSRDRRRSRSRSRSHDRRGRGGRSRSPRRYNGRYNGGRRSRFGGYRRRSRSRSVDRNRRRSPDRSNTKRSRSRSYSKSPARSPGAGSPSPSKDSSKRTSDASVEKIQHTEEIPLPPPAQPVPVVAPEMPEYEEIDELIYLDVEWGKNGKKLKRNVEKSSSCYCKHQGHDCSDTSCANRAMLMECPARCVPGCKNRNFSNKNYAPIEAFYTGPNKGWGVRATGLITKGTFITEYLGEVVTTDEFQARTLRYAKDPKHKHHYIFELGKKLIDATVKGNCSRFINHSCEPNAVCYKWAVPKTPRDVGRIGFFATTEIYPGEEITFDYQFCNYGKAQQCYCGAAKCKGTIGEIAEEGESDVEGEDESEETPSDMDDEEKSEEERRKAEIRADNAHKKVTSILQLVSIPGSKMPKKAKVLVKEMLFLDEETDLKRRVISYLEGSADFFKVAKMAHLFDVFASWLSSSEWEHHDMYLKTEVIRLIGKQDAVDTTSGWTIPCIEAVEFIASMEMPVDLAARDVMSFLLDTVASDGEVEMDGDTPTETYEKVFNEMRQEARDLMNNIDFEEVKRCCNVTKFKIPKKKLKMEQQRAAAGKEAIDEPSTVKESGYNYHNRDYSRWTRNHDNNGPHFGRSFHRRRFDRFIPHNDRNSLSSGNGPQRRIFFPDQSGNNRFGNRKRGYEDQEPDLNGFSAKRQLPDPSPVCVPSPVEMELASSPEISPPRPSAIPQVTPIPPFGLRPTSASSENVSSTSVPPPPADMAAYYNWYQAYPTAPDRTQFFNLATSQIPTLDEKIAFYVGLDDDTYKNYQESLEKELSYMKVALPGRLDAAFKRAQLVAEEERKKLVLASMAPPVVMAPSQLPPPTLLTVPQVVPPPQVTPQKKKEYMWIRARDPNDASGEVYFYHKLTNQTVWELPAGEEYDPDMPVAGYSDETSNEPDSSSMDETRPDLAARLEEVFSEASASKASSSVGRPHSRVDSYNHHQNHQESAKKKVSEEKLLKKFKNSVEAVVYPTVRILLNEVPSADDLRTKWMAKQIAKEMAKRESARPDFDYVMHNANKDRINSYAKKYLTRKIRDEKCAELWKGYEYS